MRKIFIALLMIISSTLFAGYNHSTILQAGLRLEGYPVDNLRINHTENYLMSAASLIAGMFSEYYQSMKMREVFFDHNEDHYNCLLYTGQIYSTGKLVFQYYEMDHCLLNGNAVKISYGLSVGLFVIEDNKEIRLPTLSEENDIRKMFNL